MTTTDEDRRHLKSAMTDVADGWKLHPFTCIRFEVLGWLDRHGWTQDAYDERRTDMGRPPSTYIAEYKCGCTAESRIKRELLDYCGKHGDNLRRIYHIPVPRVGADRPAGHTEGK